MSYFKSLDSVEETESTPIGVTSFSVIEYQYDSFLKNIDTMSDIKIRDIIKYGNYLDYDNFNDPKTRKVFEALWTNMRFIENLKWLLMNDNIFLNNTRRIYTTAINKIVYDYYISFIKDDVTNNKVLNTLLDISEIINFDYILKMSTLIDKQSAKFICLSRFSSFDKRECVKRLVEFIQNLGYDFTVKDIVYIFVLFYGESFSDLFNTIMTHTIDYYQLNPNQKKMYDNTSLAIVSIVNSMSDIEMRNLLQSYGSYLMLIDYGGKVRFSIRNLSSDYNRINSMVEFVENRFEIHIP